MSRNGDFFQCKKCHQTNEMPRAVGSRESTSRGALLPGRPQGGSCRGVGHRGSRDKGPPASRSLGGWGSPAPE